MVVRMGKVGDAMVDTASTNQSKRSGWSFSRRRRGKRTGEEEGSRMFIYSLAGRHSGLVVAKGGEGR